MPLDTKLLFNGEKVLIYEYLKKNVIRTLPGAFGVILFRINAIEIFEFFSAISKTIDISLVGCSREASGRSREANACRADAAKPLRSREANACRTDAAKPQRSREATA